MLGDKVILNDNILIGIIMLGGPMTLVRDMALSLFYVGCLSFLNCKLTLITLYIKHGIASPHRHSTICRRR